MTESLSVLDELAHRKRLMLAGVGRFLRQTKIFSTLRIDYAVAAQNSRNGGVQNMRVLIPAQSKVDLKPTENERKFLKISKYFNDGFFSRPDVFVCEIPDGYCHVGTGMVCTHDFEAIYDSQMEYRLACNRNFKWFKPVRKVHLTDGLYAAISNVFANYWQHWLVDCLPRMYSLSQVYSGERITLLVPAGFKRDWNESLAAALPEHFHVQFLPARTWVQADRVLLPSFVTARANQYAPPGYFETMRNMTCKRLGLPVVTELSERIYISRALAPRRRILNEEPLVALLRRFGFKSVIPEKMPFKEQVDLFRRASIIAGPYGSNWGNIIYSGPARLFVLYGDRPPETHVFTLAKSLSQEHFFLAGEEKSVDADFSVDLAAVEKVLKEELNLQASDTAC